MRRLNLHIDETGNYDLSEGVYMVVVVLHEHDWAIDDAVRPYEERLSLAELDNISFHGKDLLHSNEDYESVSIGDRKRLLTQFARLARTLPYRYFVLRYNRDDVHNQYELEAKLRRDLASVVFEKLSYFQQFDSVSVYYDGGQKTVSIALHDALDFVLARNVADFREADHSARRLLQVADYICTIERAMEGFDKGTQSNTQVRFFGSRRKLYQSYLKQISQKQFRLS